MFCIECGYVCKAGKKELAITEISHFWRAILHRYRMPQLPKGQLSAAQPVKTSTCTQLNTLKEIPGAKSSHRQDSDPRFF